MGKTATNLKNAKKWCEEARDILKIKQGTFTKDLETFESKELVKLLGVVEVGLGKLDKHDHVAYKELAAKFAETAESGHKAKKAKNQEQAKALIGKLMLLDIEIKVALGVFPPTALDEAKGNLEKRGSGEFQTALKKAEAAQKELELYSIGVHKFVGNIPAYITNAKSYAEKKPADYQMAMQQIGMVAVEKLRQEEVHRLYVKYQDRLKEAKRDERDLKITEQVSGIAKVAEPVTEIITAAQSLADQKFDYVGAATKLKEVEKAYDKAVDKLPKEDREQLEELVKVRAAFNERYVKEQTSINHARKLRDADKSPIKDLLDRAEIILVGARKKADGTKFAGVVEDADEELDGIADLVADAKKQSEEAKGDSKANLEAMWLYLKLLPRAERAYEDMKRLRGTEAEQKELFLMIGKAKGKIVADKDTGLTTGYAEGAKEIENYEKVHKAAIKKFQAIMSQDLPQPVVDAANKVYEAIHSLAGIASQFEIDVRLQDMKDQSGNIRNALTAAKSEDARLKAEAEAVRDILTFADELTEQRKKLLTAKQLFETKRDKWKSEYQRLFNLGMPADVLADAARQARLGIDVDGEDHEWQRAVEKLDLALGMIAEIEKTQGAALGEWLVVQQKITELKATAKKLTKWPPLNGSAQLLIQECEELEGRYNRSHDFAASVKEFIDLKIEARGMKLVSDAKTAPSGKELDDFYEALVLANANVREVIYKARTEKLHELEKALKGLGEPNVTPFHDALKTAEADWNRFYMNPPLTIAEVRQQAKDVMAKVQENARKIGDILAKPQLLEGLEKKLKQDENKRHENDLPALVGGLIDQLEAAGVNVTKHRRDLKVITEAGVQVPELLQKMRDEMVKLLADERTKIEKKFEQATQMAEMAEKTLAGLKTRYKNFKGYHALLEKQMGDIKAMISSGDPDLLALAKRSLNDLVNRTAEIDPKQRGEEELHYSAVVDEWAKLSKLVGDGKLKNRMPNTYARLKAELEDTIVKAKKSSPKDGMAMLKKLEAPLEKAVDDAQKLDDDHQRYKERKSQFKKNWEEVVKQTRTRFTEKTDAVAEWIEERLSEAEGLRHTETGLPKAYELLAKLEKVVDDIAKNPDPRNALQKLDAKLEQEQRLMRDMAREFEKEVGIFTEKLIPETKEIVKQREKTGQIRSADMKDTLEMVDGLKKVADSASKVVKPYLANLEVIGKGAQKAPNIDKVREDFKTARRILEEGRRTAARFSGQTMTTNVNISEDFNKVQKNWTDQVKLYSSTVRAAVSKLNATVEELRKEGTLTTDMETNAKEAVKIIERVEGHFSLAAFKKPFTVLSGGKKETEQDRLAAREEALRTMRQYRTDVLNHPVLKKLTADDNPFEQPKLTAAVGYLRAALKRIEIESLIGV